MRVTKPSLKDLAQVSVMIICSDTESKGSGTIVCVDDILYVLTAYHVIENCAKESISVSAEKDKKIYTFKCKKIVHPDPDKDCAVLQVSNDDSYPEGPLRRVRILKQVPNGEGVLCGFDKDRQEVKVYPFNQVGENKWALHYFDVSSQPITAKENWGGFSGGGIFYKGEKGELFLTYYMKGLKNIEGNNNEFVCYPATNFTGCKLLQEIILDVPVKYVSDEGLIRDLEIDKSPLHFLTSTPMIADFSNVIGREKDLQTLWEELKVKKHIMLTGFGGIGKTKLAQLLFHEYESEFDEVAWINYLGGLRKSFLAGITAKQFQESNYQNEKERWNAINSTLANDGKKKLIIIDNVDRETEQDPEQDTELRDLTGWKDTTILLTSRLERLEHFDEVTLDALEMDNCFEIFKHYYKKNIPNLETVKKIIELADRHTLTIELLAKGASQERFDDYYEKVKKGFDKVDSIMTTTHHKGEETIARHLQYLFNMQKRNPMEKKVLYSFAILPVNCECTKEELEQWFGFKTTDWNAVVRDGWLMFNKIKATYSMHTLVRTIVRFDFKEDEKKNKVAPKGITDKILVYFTSHRDLFNIDKGYISLQRIKSIAEAIMCTADQEKRDRIAGLYNNIGFSCSEIGDYNQALEYYLKALGIVKKRFCLRKPIKAQIYSNLGVAYNNLGDFDKALTNNFKSLMIRKIFFGNNRTEIASSYNNIGGVYKDLCDYRKAMKYFQKALATREKVLGTEHPDTAVTYNNIGALYMNQGNYDKALECYQKALVIWKGVLGTEHPNIAKSYLNIGSVYDAQGKFKIALENSFKAKEIMEKLLGIEHSDTALSYNNIGLAYHHQRKYSKALEFYFRALTIQEKILGTEHPDTALLYNNIGLVYNDQGDSDKALEYHLKALAIKEKVLGTKHPHTATSYDNIGAVYCKNGDLGKALAYHLKALEIKEKSLGIEHPETAKSFNNIAGVYFKQRNYGKALENLTKAYLICEKVHGHNHYITKNLLKGIDIVKKALGSKRPISNKNSSFYYRK